MNSITKEIAKLWQIKEIVNSYRDLSPIHLYGLSDSSKTHIICTLFEQIEKTTLLICENEKIAKKFVYEINSICNDKAFFMPSLEVNFYNIKSIERDNEVSRLNVLNKLINKDKIIIVTTIEALRNKLTDKNTYLKNTIKIDFDYEIDIQSFKEKLIFLNYRQNKLVEGKCQFSIRGSIIDIWPLSYDNPIRIELFDTEIDSIRSFDNDTQRSIDKLEEVIISPASELLYDKSDYESVIENIKNDLSNLSKKNSSNPKDTKLMDKYKQILSFLEDRFYIANEDLITAYRNSNYSTFFDYLPEDSFIIYDDFSRCLETFNEMENKFEIDLAYQMDNGEVFASFKNLRIEWSKIYKNSLLFPILDISSLLKRSKLLTPKRILELNTIEAENFNKNINSFIESMKYLENNKAKVVILAGDEEKKANIIKILQENNLNYSLDLKKDLEINLITLSDSDLNQGYFIPEINFYVLTHKEIFGRNKVRKKRKSKKSPSASDIINYSDLEIGDYVVHENNGIGIYKGIKKIEVNSIIKDYVVIEYKGNDKLFVPIDQMGLINKYIGNKGEKPKISTLGGSQWTKAKNKAKKAVEEIAEDLLNLYAKRSKAEGHAFSKDTPWQKEFEESFPYEETISQLRSIDEIKADMEDTKPMDRLLCGDVGYGKTEVALRAAFKAINDGYQVAFLVPTTILARQHYLTIKDRFKDFPVSSAMLSRFSTTKEEKEALKGLKSGKVDIVVGTHRLLSKDIKFNKLGLLIIDEEQRFGVKHKEKLKSLKENLDVLTLSATPIPRTLQMSLTGIRDMSTLDEPPEERIPVNTYVIEFNESIIKQAIEKELARDGQVYFVYNRVKDIDFIYNKLQDLVPDANIAIAHGQMTSRQLENIMEDFINREIDILLSTTIIETGMDIQNVNTIIVYDSDMMGLSQLYQLKGRIGRSSRTSYAYFTYRKGKTLSEIGQKRLKSIKDFSDFGSGYKIAMRDLELRGAGNILGESQSGHVESIGYDLYVKFLQEAIEEASNTKDKPIEQKDVYIDIKVDAYIPAYYIEDPSQKIEIYNRISKINDLDDYDILVEDLIDRYGDIPIMVDNIMYISLIKSMASKLGFYEIREIKDTIYLYYENRDKYSFEELSKINDNFIGNLSLDLSNKPAFKINYEKNKLLDCYELLKTINEIEE
ncbi:MAG: transcription-repair coupling factor [Peptoniphilaceae bacterium]|nr:transcription-repair coupling factor [Peptoniphilaceae bacterium]MDY6019634.1 transcription-repair coupling factor [Anaerococcus sp.]